MTRSVKLALAMLSLAFFAYAQDFRATITGQVTDASGAAVPNAIVKAVSTGTNEVTEAKTNTGGYYTIPYLNPGTYRVEISAQGFQSVRRENIVLRVADKQNLPVSMQVGQMSQEVTVNEQQEIVQTANADRGLVFDPVKTQEYPLNGRQSYMLLALTPGVIFTQEQFGANGFSGTRGWDVNGSYRINGGRSGTNQFLLNGAPISVSGSWQIAPNVEAIQEFKVQTSTYDAQFGRTGGGTVNTTLKSGSNDWHGDVFDYWRNSILDANTFQNNAVNKPKGFHNQHQFGGVVGGPIRKDKDFVFGSFEGWREVVPFPTVQSTPPLDIRDGQHFTNYGVKIYDPLTTRPCLPSDNCGDQSYIRDPFPGNVIPASRISPIGQKILSLFPAPNQNLGNLSNNFLASPNLGRYGYDQPMARWDHVFNDRNKFYALFTFQHGHEFRNNNGFDPPAQRGNIISERQDQNYIADYTRVFSPTTIIDVRASFGRFTSIFPDGSNSFGFTYSQLGIKQMPTPPTVGRQTAPVVRLDMYPDIIGNSYTWSTDNQIDFAPSVTQTKGKQTWHYGFEMALLGNGSGGPGLANGRLDFNSKSVTRKFRDKDTTGDGSGVAALLLGVPNGGQIDYNDTYFRRRPYYAGFFQDDWKILPRLSLNVGLRYEVQVPFIEQHDRVNGYFDFNAKNPLSDQIVANWTTKKQQWDAGHPGQEALYPAPPSVIKGGLTFPGVNGQPRRVYDIDWTNFQPRIGAAFQITPKTVLRGGFGIYHRSTLNGQVSNGFSLSTNYNYSSNGLTPNAGLTGPYSLENPFPSGYQTPTGSSLGLLTAVGNGVSFDNRNLPIPRTFEWSFGIQRELPWAMVVEASYSANKTVHEPVAIQEDYLSPQDISTAQQTPAYGNTSVPNPFYGILPANSNFGNSTNINNRDLRRPFPEFNGVLQYTNPFGKYRYDSLQLSLEKRVLNTTAGVMTFVFSYTFSKSYEQNHFLGLKNPGQGDFGANYPGVTPIKELDYQDKPQSIAFSGVWDLPIGQKRRFFSGVGPIAGALVNGWSMSYIFTYYSGYPVSKPDAIFTCGDYRVQNQTYQHWFNNDPSCYHDYPAYTFRNQEDRFSNIRTPDYGPQINLAFEKSFRFKERYSFQLRAESFNLTNTPIFPGPATDWRNTSTFGVVNLTQQNFPRLVQLAGKFYF